MTEVQSTSAVADPFSNIADLLTKCGGCAVIDGGMAVQLEHYGARLLNPLWTALCLITNPAAVRQVHWDYLEAGAQVVLTASYQATLQGFESQGYSIAEGEDLLTKSVSLAIEARDQFWNEYQQRVQNGSDQPGRYCRALVAASVGSYGAYLADGSEYSGEYGPEMTLEKLKEFHRRRLVVLAEAKPDILALETIPSKFEAQALIEVLEEEDVKVPAWISFNSKDGVNVVRGDSLKDCAELVDRSNKVVAVGINCTPPSMISGLIRIAHQVTAKPILVYPNRGENWDAVAKHWISSTGASDDDFAKYVDEWKQAGASLIGGCCQTTPATVRAIAGALHPDHRHT
ncbi:unnamed protein product [Calypogeia fissa]